MRRNLTVFTDAAFCHESSKAGGGFWAFFGDDQEIRGRITLNSAEDPAEAEIRVAVEALNFLLLHESVSKWRKRQDQLRVVLVVDATAVKHAFERPRPHYLTVALLERLAKWRAVLQINHVKAHTTDRSPRSLVNRWCDRQAALALRALTQPITLEEVS